MCSYMCIQYVSCLKGLECIAGNFFSPLHLKKKNWLHKKASCEPSSLNEKHVAGVQNSGVFQHGPGRHLFLVCRAKSWSRERGSGGKGGGGREEERRKRRRVGGWWVLFFFSGRCLRRFGGRGGRNRT